MPSSSQQSAMMPVETTRRRKVRLLNWMVPLWLVSSAALLLLVLVPIGYMAFESIRNDGDGFFAAYITSMSDPFLRQSAINSALVALAVGVGSVLVAAPLAFGVARTRMRGKRLVYSSVIVSIISPDFLIAMAYISLMGPNAGYVNEWLRNLSGSAANDGPLNIFTLWGFIFIAVPRGVAFVFLTLVPAFQNSDPALEEASRIAGAGPLRTIFSVTVPILRPAILSGALITFALVIAMFGTPYMLNVNVLPIAIRQSLILSFDFQTAATLSMILTILCVVALLGYQLSTRTEARFRTLGGKSFNARPFDIGTATRRTLTAFSIVYAVVAFLLPYGTLFMVSLMRSVGGGLAPSNMTLDNYVEVLTSSHVQSGFSNSFILSLGTATVLALLCPIIAYVVVKSRSRARRILDYVSILPLGIPGTAIATALMIAYLNPPLSGLGLYGTLGILLLAYLAIGVPFGMRMSQSTLLQFSPELEEASRVSGASQLRTIFSITLPMMKSTILYVWVLVFILTFPEMSASALLAGVQSQVAATVILDLWAGSGGLTQASAVSVVMFVGIVGLLGFSQLLIRRSRVRIRGRFG